MSIQTFPPQGYVALPSKVEGVTIFQRAAASANLPDVQDFKCPKCGATTAYDVSVRQVACAHCGYAEGVNAKTVGRSAEQFEFKVETLARSQKGWGTERKELSCQRCGGLVSLPPDTLSYCCPFCGSNKVLVREPLQDVLRPRYIIPFQVTPQVCSDTVRAWLGSSWMLPAELRSAAMLDHFTPLYLPYWTFEAMCHALWKAQVGKRVREHYYVGGERRERTRVEWHTESGTVNKPFSNLLVPGTGRINMSVLSKIDNFDPAALTMYEPALLAGMQAAAYDVPLEQAWDAGRQVMRERTRETCRDKASSDLVRDFNMSLDFQEESWRYILVPLYTSVYRFNDKTYQILVNGQSGAIGGPRPVDWGKVWLAVGALLAPGLLVGLLGLLTLLLQVGALIAGFGLFLLVIGMVISFFIFTQAQGMENGTR